jgi:flavin reductase (DIM6/NTAB) family NADH-FMN oxidoreductase RutF
MEYIQTGSYVPLPAAPIVLVGALVDGKPNFTTAAFVAGMNARPAVVGVSLNKNHYTPRGMIANGTFSLNIPGTEDVVKADYCGLVSGRNADKSRIFRTW